MKFKKIFLLYNKQRMFYNVEITFQDNIIHKKTYSNLSEMADKLGISPRTLRYKLAKMRDAGIDIPN